MISSDVISDFISNFQSRIAKYDYGLISEDCIRYDFFNALLKKTDISNIVLEFPHSEYARKEIDCVIMSSEKSKTVGIEFKFFSETESGDLPKTLNMGKLLADCYRLLNSSNLEQRFIVFVSMQSMNTYIQNTKNHFSALYTEESMKITKSLFIKTNTLVSAIKEGTDDSIDFIDFIVTKKFLGNYRGRDDCEYKVVILEVLPAKI